MYCSAARMHQQSHPNILTKLRSFLHLSSPPSCRGENKTEHLRNEKKENLKKKIYAGDLLSSFNQSINQSTNQSLSVSKMQFIDCRDNVIMTTSLGNALTGYRMHTMSTRRSVRFASYLFSLKKRTKQKLLACSVVKDHDHKNNTTGV